MLLTNQLRGSDHADTDYIDPSVNNECDIVSASLIRNNLGLDENIQSVTITEESPKLSKQVIKK